MMNAVCPVKYEDRDGNEKTKWVKLGVAFVNREKGTIKIQLDGLPVNGELVLMKPMDRDGGRRGGGGGGGSRRGGGGGGGGYRDEDAPF